MEAYKGGIKGYWKRHGYHRLDGAAAARRPPLPTAELGDGRRHPHPPQQQPPRRRGWRVRLGRRMRVRLWRALSPRRWLARLRDAYVSAMLRLASSPAVGYGSGGFYGGYPDAAFARPRQLKEYDEKVLVEIYKSILASGPLAVAGAGDTAPVV